MLVSSSLPNGIQNASPVHYSFIILNAYFTMLSGMVFRLVEFNMFLNVSVLRLWEWRMILALHTQLRYVSVLHRTVRLYYCGFQGKEGICLILVTQTFCPSVLSVVCLKCLHFYYMINYVYFTITLNSMVWNDTVWHGVAWHGMALWYIIGMLVHGV